MPVLRVLLIFTLCLTGTYDASGISIIDDEGNEVSLKLPAERIITMSPDLTEIVFSLDAGHKIVGADEYSNYLFPAKEVPRVNNHSAVNFELIMSLEPDLIIAWGSGNGKRTVGRLRGLGLPVFVVETKKISQIPSLYLRLGALIGETSAANKMAEFFSTTIVDLNNRDERKVTVFYEIWNDPLMTLSGQHLVGDVIKLCGGQNIFEDLKGIASIVSIESVIAANPEVIITSGHPESFRSWSSQWTRWPDLRAVRDENLFMVSPELLQRQSPRLIKGIKSVCSFLQEARTSE